MNDVTYNIRSALADAIQTALTDEALAHAKKKLQSLYDEIHCDFEYRVQDYLSYNLAAYAQRMAHKAIDAILKGDEEEMRRRLQCVEGSWTGRDRSHPVIHGSLFEQGAIALRKAIVEAHAELLKTERILDLEDQVKSLVEQVNKAEAERERMWERLRTYEG